MLSLKASIQKPNKDNMGKKYYYIFWMKKKQLKFQISAQTKIACRMQSMTEHSL